jgi:hypothetical protein
MMDSIQSLKKRYGCGDVSKEAFAAALRAHQAVVDQQKVHRGRQQQKPVSEGEGEKRME